MFKLLNHKLDQLSEKKFIIMAPIISFFSDIILLAYLSKVLSPKIINDKFLFKMAKLQNIPIEQLSPDSLKMLKEMMQSSLSLGLLIIIIYNAIIYILCMRNKKWAKKYVKGYALSAALLSVVEIIFVYIQASKINPITVITMLLYFFVYYGFKYFKEDSKPRNTAVSPR